MTEYKTFTSPTIVEFQGTEYWVVGTVLDFFNSGPAVRLQPTKGGACIVVTHQDAEWDDLTITEEPRTMSVEVL